MKFLKTALSVLILCLSGPLAYAQDAETVQAGVRIIADEVAKVYAGQA